MNEYCIKDHLGNTRLTFADKNNNGQIDVTTHGSTNEILQVTERSRRVKCGSASSEETAKAEGWVLSIWYVDGWPVDE